MMQRTCSTVIKYKYPYGSAVLCFVVVIMLWTPVTYVLNLPIFCRMDTNNREIVCILFGIYSARHSNILRCKCMGVSKVVVKQWIKTWRQIRGNCMELTLLQTPRGQARDRSWYLTNWLFQNSSMSLGVATISPWASGAGRYHLGWIILIVIFG